MFCLIDSIGGKGPFSPLSPSDWIVCMVYGAAIAMLQLCREGQGKLRVPSCQLALELPKGKKKTLLSRVQLFATSQNVALQAPLSTEFSPHWSGSHSHLPNPGTEPISPALQADSLLSKPQGNPRPQDFILSETLKCFIA